MFRSHSSLCHINNNVPHINNNVPHINNNAGLCYYRIVFFLHNLFVLPVCACASVFVCLCMNACMCGSIQLFTYLDADASRRAT